MLNVAQFVLLQSLLVNCHATCETQYQPTQDELGALRWFLYLSEQGEEER
jgi:hypothetical protein